jgi:hypothetical protein
MTLRPADGDIVKHVLRPHAVQKEVFTIDPAAGNLWQ